MTPADVLRKAADYIEVHGWVQGRPQEAGSVCVARAIRVCATGTRQFLEARAPLLSALGMDHALDLPNWNDTPGRTAEEVIATLRSVAARLDIDPTRAGTSKETP